MASACSMTFPFNIFLTYKCFSIPKPCITKTLTPTPSIPGATSISRNKHYPCLPISCCSTSSSSSTETHNFPSTIIFIKGLPLSTSERQLKTAFSEFGEITRVKIGLNKITQQSLGFAFVWFTDEKSAQLTVKEMNGKFFNGRFISVTMARPGSCKTKRKDATYKF